MNFHSNKTYQEPSKFSGPAHFMVSWTTDATENILAGDYLPLVLWSVFRHVRIAATAPITFVMSVRVSTGNSAAPTDFRELHIRDFNFTVARDINRP